jgi:hypothetical protein
MQAEPTDILDGKEDYPNSELQHKEISQWIFQFPVKQFITQIKYQTSNQPSLWLYPASC